MQNERSFDVAPDPTVQANSAAGMPPPQATSVRAAAPPQGAPISLRASPYVLPTQARRGLWKVIAIGLVLVLGVVGGIIALITQLGRQQQVQSGEYSVIKLPLGDLTDTSIPIEDATSLKINGQLDVSGSIVLSPSAQPKNPLIGQLYFDQTSNKLSYYDGQQFLTVGGQSTGTSTQTPNTTNNVANVTNILGGSGNSQTGVELQATAPGTQQTGNFNISGIGQVGTLKTTVVKTDGQALFVNPTVIDTTLPTGVDTTLGSSVVGTSIAAGPGWQGVLSATKVTTGDLGGTLKSLSVYLTGGTGSGHVQLAIYDDDGNVPSQPSSLLASSAITSLVPNGVTTVTMPNISLSANSTYWLAVNTDDNTVGRPYVGGTKASCFATKTFGSMLSPFGGCFFDNNAYTIYGTYTTTASPGGVSKAQLSIGSSGQVLLQNDIDSDKAFQIQNASGSTTLFNVDTVNNRIAIGKASASYKLDIAGGDINLSNGRSVRFGGVQALSMNGSGSVTSLTNFQSGGSVSVQAANFYVQDADATHQNLAINSNGGATFSNRVDSSTGFQVQNAAGQNLIAADTSTGSVALTGRATGTISVATAANTGVTGDITIKTGDSSTTASGDITIDAGTGVVSGTVVSDKTFESGTEHVVDWFNTTVATTTAQAHSGAQSLSVTMNSSFWGIQEDQNFALTPVTPGHNYHFSFWVRAGTNPRNIGSHVTWTGTGGQTTTLQMVTDSTTGWTEVTGNGVAPAGATSVYFVVSGSGTSAGEVHYFDDMSVTDLSSSSATSVLRLGDTNAQIVNIGNLNQIGATTIKGGSGIDIQSGASSITMSGGVINITGNAASNLTTTAGALTINSAAAASWGVSQASSGVGGNLTLHAGTGGTDANNDGGDLILQGGNKNGTGIGGSVVVKPQSDATDAFQVQNSSGVAFLVADTTAMKISVTGTTTTFASLTLANAHFASTQTNPPTIGTPSNCGVTPTAVVTAGSTDTAGSFVITTGSGGTSSTCDVVFTFNRPYGAAPKSIMVVGKGDAASAARQAYVVSSNTTSFTLSFGASAAGANNTPYSFSYWVVE